MHKSLPKSVFVTLGGGLGDVFYVYYNGENGWGYIESLKKKYPHIHVKAMCSTHNPQTLEFIKYNPHIDESIDFGWVNDARPLWEKNSEGARRLDKEYELLKSLKVMHPKLYLSEDDKVDIEMITSQIDGRPYIMIHPFAGEPHRATIPPEEYVPLIDSIIDNLGFSVVLIGASYKRTNLIKKEDKQEKLNYQRDHLVNLIDKTNSRVCCALISKQYHFIGTWSAFSCASWINKKETTIILKKHVMKTLLKKTQRGQRWNNAKINKIIYEDKNNNINSYDKIRNQIIKSIKKNEQHK